MKKLLFALLLLTAGAMAGCSDDDEPVPDPWNTPDLGITASIVGTWNLYKESDYETDTGEIDWDYDFGGQHGTLTYRFEADGTGQYVDTTETPTEQGSFAYRVEGDELFTDTGREKAQFHIDTLTDEEMVLVGTVELYPGGPAEISAFYFHRLR